MQTRGDSWSEPWWLCWPLVNLLSLKQVDLYSPCQARTLAGDIPLLAISSDQHMSADNRAGLTSWQGVGRTENIWTVSGRASLQRSNYVLLSAEGAREDSGWSAGLSPGHSSPSHTSQPGTGDGIATPQYITVHHSTSHYITVHHCTSQYITVLYKWGEGSKKKIIEWQ